MDEETFRQELAASPKLMLELALGVDHLRARLLIAIASGLVPSDLAWWLSFDQPITLRACASERSAPAVPS